MQSEVVISSPPAGSLVAAGTATTAATPNVAAAPEGDGGAVERWRIWSARGLVHDRERARTITRGFVAIVAALSAWLIFRLLS